MSDDIFPRKVTPEQSKSDKSAMECTATHSNPLQKNYDQIICQIPSTNLPPATAETIHQNNEPNEPTKTMKTLTRLRDTVTPEMHARIGAALKKANESVKGMTLSQLADLSRQGFEFAKQACPQSK